MTQQLGDKREREWNVEDKSNSNIHAQPEREVEEKRASAG